VSDYPKVTITGGFTVGAGTAYPITGPIEGLGLPKLRVNDVDRGHRDGAVAANDYYTTRVVSVPVAVLGADIDDTLALLDDLTDNWAASDVDLDLTIELSATRTMTFTGRPGASGVTPVELDLTLL